ncbi:glutamine amidotransferase [Arenimonas sp.]|uniref:glutamine amidotransferase n=1 Tax=Arenimonas sp. TaxID=1872635 RepID=UPI0035B099CB
MKSFLLIETGDPVPSLRRHGSFGHWIRVAAGLSGRESRMVRVFEGEDLPDPTGHAGVLISGSGAMVTDRQPWSERTADWLRDAAQAGHPLFGICYGHQLIAHALGGEVGDNPQGREMGTVCLDLADSAGQDPLFEGFPDKVPAQATHLQTVVRPPPGARVLAASGRDDCQAFRWGEATWGVQFHPEFSVGVMKGYIRARADALREEGTCPRELAGAVRPTPTARRVLRRFIHLARQRARNGA